MIPRFKHQDDAFEISKDRKVFALLMDMGTGKSRVIVETACHLYQKGEIDTVIIFSPKGVHYNWMKEIEMWMWKGIAYWPYLWSSTLKPREKYRVLALTNLHQKKLRFYSFNVDAVSIKAVKMFLSLLVRRKKTMLVVDESTKIKNPSTARTKNLWLLSEQSMYKRILTGTVIANNPLDLFAQFKFLTPMILRQRNFYFFKKEYAITKKMFVAGGRTIDVIVGYRNVHKLEAMVSPHSFKITKEQCLDLPEKIYQIIAVDMTEQQKELYLSLRERVLYHMISNVSYLIDMRNVLTMLLRLQQLTGGFLHPDEADFVEIKPNPKLDALLDVVEEIGDSKMIVWSRFVPEIKMLYRELSQNYSCVTYYGDTSDTDREKAIESFQNGKTQILIGNQAVGGMGINLTAASYVIYYSNSYSSTDRLQSEDRAHRAGQEKHVTYIDLIVNDSVDTKVLEALRAKKNFLENFNARLDDLGDYL